jgi:hypothetical protein
MKSEDWCQLLAQAQNLVRFEIAGSCQTPFPSPFPSNMPALNNLKHFSLNGARESQSAAFIYGRIFTNVGITWLLSGQVLICL